MLTEEQIYMEAATHEAVDRNPLLASEKPYTKGFSAGAFWANGQNAAEIAAKDAEISELVDALRALKSCVVEMMIPALNLIPAGSGSGFDFPSQLIWAETVGKVDTALTKYPE